MTENLVETSYFTVNFYRQKPIIDWIFKIVSLFDRKILNDEVQLYLACGKYS